MINPSICVLVQNDEYFLPYVLSQTEGFFNRYVIYDVGSADGTPNIIDWWTERMKSKVDIFVRELPNVPPEVQGTFRNSMIAEGARDAYLILDGDELYPRESLEKISGAADELINIHNKINSQVKFGVFRRVELNNDLTQQYDIRRSHHRLYTRDAYWLGTHPGEVSKYKQNEKSELWFNDITLFHMHNALRSSKENEALKRIQRKSQKTYHPGELIPIDILKELPILRSRIESFPVSPALEALWK